MILTSAFYYQIRVTNVRLQVERECPNIKQTVKLWPQHFFSLGTNQRPPWLASFVVFKGSLNVRFHTLLLELDNRNSLKRDTIMYMKPIDFGAVGQKGGGLGGYEPLF